MSRIPWRFYDPVLLEEYVWPVNPYQDGGSHSIEKESVYVANVANYRNSAGVDSVGTVIYSKGISLSSFSYTGFVYTEEHLDTMNYWVSKDYAIELTDDLGQHHLILVESFGTERVRSRQSPFKHGYAFSGIILQEL